MIKDYLHTCIPATGVPVHRLGLSASYWPGKKSVRHGTLDAGEMAFMHRFGDAVRASSMHLYSLEDRRNTN